MLLRKHTAHSGRDNYYHPCSPHRTHTHTDTTCTNPTLLAWMHFSPGTCAAFHLDSYEYYATPRPVLASYEQPQHPVLFQCSPSAPGRTRCLALPCPALPWPSAAPRWAQVPGRTSVPGLTSWAERQAAVRTPSGKTAYQQRVRQPQSGTQRQYSYSRTQVPGRTDEKLLTGRPVWRKLGLGLLPGTLLTR